MLILTIIYKGNKKELLDDIYGIKNYLDDKKIHIGISENIHEGFDFIKIFSGEDSIREEEIDIIYKNMTEILYKYLILEFYNREVDSTLCDSYFFLKKEEMEDVKIKLADILLNHDKISDEDTVYCINRINEIKEDILELLRVGRGINMDGYITFRSREMGKKVNLIIDKIVEKYMVEKEYDEFIKLLKYFVDMQESKVNRVDIMIDYKGEYSIKDENGEDASELLFDKVSIEGNKESVSMEDMIMSGLVTNSPKTIILHGDYNAPNKEFINTIQNVFGDRVKLCKGCKACNSITHQNNQKY